MKFQQIGQVSLPRQLECLQSFGSLVIGIPDKMGRAGCHGPSIATLSPGAETWGLHAEGAAMTRSGDASQILERWEALINTLSELSEGRGSREAAARAIAELEQFILGCAKADKGYAELFVTVRAAASVAPVPFEPAAASDAASSPQQGEDSVKPRAYNPMLLTQLPGDVVSVGYKETRPFHHAQVFRSERVNFQGTEAEFVAAGLAYQYTQVDRFTRSVFAQ